MLPNNLVQRPPATTQDAQMQDDHLSASRVGSASGDILAPMHPCTLNECSALSTKHSPTLHEDDKMVKLCNIQARQPTGIRGGPLHHCALRPACIQIAPSSGLAPPEPGGQTPARTLPIDGKTPPPPHAACPRNECGIPPLQQLSALASPGHDTHQHTPALQLTVVLPTSCISPCLA